MNELTVAIRFMGGVASMMCLAYVAYAAWDRVPWISILVVVIWACWGLFESHKDILEIMFRDGS